MKLATASITLFAAMACSVDQQATTAGCAAIADCPLGEACDVLAKRCVPEPTSGFMGRFRCQLHAPGGSPNMADTAEVVGSVNGDRWSFTALAGCIIDSEQDELTFQLLQYSSTFTLNLVVQASSATSGAVSLGPAATAFGVNAATLYDTCSDHAPAYSSRGTLRIFSNQVADGSTIDAYLQVDMYPTAVETDAGVEADAFFGVPCPRGMADCGVGLHAAGGALQCAPLGGRDAICMRDCTTAEECMAGGASCVLATQPWPNSVGWCVRTCSSSTDCSAPLTCGVADWTLSSTVTVCR
jgi:hypothetical protein